MQKALGGVNVSENIDLESELFSFSERPYIYEFRSLQDGEFSFDRFSSVTIFCEWLAPGSHLIVNDHDLLQDSAAQVENMRLRLRVSGQARVFISGVRERREPSPTLRIQRLDEMKKVVKPWGNEIWINGEHRHYAFKRIEIKAGTKTSLQYHRFKKETNLLFRGSARLYYKRNSAIENDRVQFDDLGSIDLQSISSIDVLPQHLHRLEALSDVLLFETSTAHLDDVIRVSDDSARGHGRISAEHL